MHMLGKEEKILEDPMEQAESERHSKKGHSSRRADREIPKNNLTQIHSSERTERIFPQKARWDPMLQVLKVAGLRARLKAKMYPDRVFSISKMNLFSFAL